MKTNSSGKILGAATAMAALAMIGCASSSADTMTYDPGKPVMKPADQVAWMALNPAISMGHAYGNRGEGAHGSFGRFPAEFITPIHVHSHPYHAIVLSGIMTNPMGADGEKNPPVLGPGSYWYVPAGAPHATACISATPCEFYFHMDAAFDFTPLEGQ